MRNERVEVRNCWAGWRRALRPQRRMGSFVVQETWMRGGEEVEKLPGVVGGRGSGRGE